MSLLEAGKSYPQVSVDWLFLATRLEIVRYDVIYERLFYMTYVTCWSYSQKCKVLKLLRYIILCYSRHGSSNIHSKYRTVTE
jgi:hypothetical protein